MFLVIFPKNNVTTLKRLLNTKKEPFESALLKYGAGGESDLKPLYEFIALEILKISDEFLLYA